MNSLDDFGQIRQLAEDDFEALHTGASVLFAKVFHPDARLCCAVSKGYVTMDVPKYLEFERNRESPEADFVEMGGFAMSTTKEGPIYFIYCGGITAANRIYLDASTGQTYR